MNIVLYQPEIPPNTGNIARTCACTGVSLHLIRPLGFSTDEKALRRAGLDYWDKLDIYYYDSFKELIKEYPKNNFYFATKFATKFYTDIEYQEDDFLVFGRETAGLPGDITNQYKESCIRIPMKKDTRSLNLANSVSIILYEALRQNNFNGLT
ncbi:MULTISPECIES: tRNA (uridine(34)/cytosine(34)/5-carboxymethylaminomethyluridine(34)-2'-O)-methyltransferase TrmL [unclassified Candidatus Frackibacter]|uniref:tRNA (uridine(34)/cytosine(34)/5- carboxymethylaminomethyluridine(34)-2'-O)- methyltransferase TrmL n=1 Tax=unclassified Candidatus Frackibacter TaxID=2648818 RepID=UPI0008877D82|nr:MULTISPECIES: tRNA (uridine(34)/cytosine(34)/5-carboxymethylaminomethyluridine(34)-2'-O)-methyltransferase TrmL [unclassified Candidatus Frackibacter]SDC17722.1 tRNA (cytidine/uridine-2'-O-)-methyltransferase [Candidatus Frackibacter sp. WG11]SEM44247.1 tRNA (cytidine/uridine-2'-O-)-methyltransferase [Candidatus Frackibacter sp. WG12]SFL46796.1 tRNA (cytidine/uridine-2'-O-)-methyltransferase [Candidatus Frackibacter sp. WG13]